MNDKNKKFKVVILLFAITAIILITGLTYAFFANGVSNGNNERISANAATLSLVFEDDDNGVSGTLNLGESVTKKFTIENTGTLDAYAKINWVDLINTYLSGSLTYNLEQSTSENGTYTSIKIGNVPVSSTATTTELKNGILVPVNTMYYYKLTIILNNLDVNQNSDITANFHSYFNLQEGNLTGTESIQNLVAGKPSNTTDVITKPAPSGANCTNTLAYDGTADNNLRYVWANPCNYVIFNGETAKWRIVGIMNNVDDGTGKKESKIKLVRYQSIGNYSWDTSDSSVNGGSGRAICFNTSLREQDGANCYSDLWVSNLMFVWTLNIVNNSGYAFFILNSSSRYVRVYDSTYRVYPSVYLKSNVSIKSGNGSAESPYELEFN